LQQKLQQIRGRLDRQKKVREQLKAAANEQKLENTLLKEHAEKEANRINAAK
jgi:predicted component of type VI protein secretion system